MATLVDIDRLVAAMDQLLDDMGSGDGCCVCLAAKAQARIAFEPFMELNAADFYMPLAEAKRISKMADNRD